jgi:hypothetical protein
MVNRTWGRWPRSYLILLAGTAIARSPLDSDSSLKGRAAAVVMNECRRAGSALARGVCDGLESG